MKQKLLIIEAHSDDSVISTAGFLEKYRDKYDYYFMLIAASDCLLHHYGLSKRTERLKEFESYVKSFNGVWCTNDHVPFDADSRLDTLPKKEIVVQIENTISAIEPDVLICQGPSFHHDHTIVYESMVAATRPTARFYPKQIYIMENPTYVHSMGVSTDFIPNFYCSLTEEQLQKKLDCYSEHFPSQVRCEPDYLSLEGLRAWARYRGIEARCLYAEAFRIYAQLV